MRSFRSAGFIRCEYQVEGSVRLLGPTSHNSSYLSGVVLQIADKTIPCACPTPIRGVPLCGFAVVCVMPPLTLQVASSLSSGSTGSIGSRADHEDSSAVERRHSPPAGVRAQGAVVPPLQVGAAQLAELRLELQAALRDRDDARVALQVRAAPLPA